ncbi:1-aminocyclopropane-1-carboxylate deaminase/D-cysteine desulfhydrase [Lewinella sp. W8]|uniref:1-aminocyclopropane-1-carboxylate deaminase/D-cysteine desulfhydrase n=1 Tax=Lewinella sp. W8 TaxID=2528208 RepID=UPI001067CA0C|nr:pyridoxal-phosphate dependent enzyme [Lewinella sp. W8]MTB49587.1 pyridoxal-phosphate dependent enzyme [Lewinella sp. W8]
MMPFAELSSPLERLYHPAAGEAGIQLFCKRDDLLSPAPGTALQGNKVRKLAPVLRRALAARRPPLLVSFGGAYSNHASALATAGKRYHLPVHLFIRGEEVDNPVLDRAVADGATLERISRAEYRQHRDENWRSRQVLRLAQRYDLAPEEIWIIPEGGTSPQAIESVSAIVGEITEALGDAPDYVALSAGTGGTAAGVILAAEAKTRIEIFPALKGSWMREEINSRLPSPPKASWTCIHDHHFGGYGRFPQEWRIPSAGFATRADISEPGLPPLEAIYTAKLFSGVLTRIRQGCYPPGSTIVVLHTGGIY